MPMLDCGDHNSFISHFSANSFHKYMKFSDHHKILNNLDIVYGFFAKRMSLSQSTSLFSHTHYSVLKHLKQIYSINQKNSDTVNSYALKLVAIRRKH